MKNQRKLPTHNMKWISRLILAILLVGLCGIVLYTVKGVVSPDTTKLQNSTALDGVSNTSATQNNTPTESQEDNRTPATPSNQIEEVTNETVVTPTQDTKEKKEDVVLVIADKDKKIKSDVFELSLNEAMIKDGRYVIDASVTNTSSTSKPFSSIVTIALSTTPTVTDKTYFVSDLQYASTVFDTKKVLDRLIKPNETARGFVIKKTKDGSAPPALYVLLFNTKDLSLASSIQIF